MPGLILEPKPSAPLPGPPIPPKPVVIAPKASIFESKSFGSRLSTELHLNREAPAPSSTRGAVGGKKVSARFELLPDEKPRWGRIGLSAAGQLAALGLVLLSPVIFPQPMQTALKFEAVELLQPVTEIHLPPPEPPPPKIKPKAPPPEPKPRVPKPKQVVPEPPELNPRQPHVFLVLKPQLVKARAVEAKPVELKPVLEQSKIVIMPNQPKPPKEDVKVGTLSSGNPAPATVAAPPNKVQSGGFGDPNGIPGPGNPNKAGNINRAGSPSLPGGPGYGNGTGGARGLRGTVASDGSRKSGAPATGAGSAGVSILYMPNPSYSTEARTLRMEGDVVLEVVFLASGQLQVTRVVSGLGHGLDEAAIQAAKQIRFRPAQRDGRPVDFPAHVRIEFRLAK